LLVVSAVLCGANEWDEIELFGRNQEDWLRKYGSFEFGIPSHDTINRVFSAINPKEFGQCFSEWIGVLSQLSDKEVIAIDGKKICNSFDKTKGQAALHMVSAFATQSGLCLGQTVTMAKSNEITAIPELLSLLNITGSIVTIDAMGCQKIIASKIIAQGAEYILAVKGNQPSLEEGIEDTLRFEKPCDTHSDIDCDHGRVETRQCSVFQNIRHIEKAGEWDELKTIIRIDSQRIIKSTGELTSHTRYYISSMAGTAKQFNHWIRSHWAIENNLHWMLDVTFREDYSRKRQGNAAQNFNTITKLVLSILVQDKSFKASCKRKRLRAALNHEYRERLLDF
jgi:predicted transposase YbfD/YdcC